MEEKFKTIIKIISEVKEDDNLVSTLNPDTNIIEEIGLDSLQMINMMLNIEEQIGVEIDFDNFELSTLNSIRTFAEYLEGCA
jgi:acyl carrier protein